MAILKLEVPLRAPVWDPEEEAIFALGKDGRGLAKVDVHIGGVNPDAERLRAVISLEELDGVAGENLDLRLGQLAVAVGSPSGFQSTVTAGVVSGLGREIPAELTGGQQQDPALVDLIQTVAPISPGNSGGALANRSGEVVGINVAYLPPTQTGAVDIGFAIPSPTAFSVADQLIEDGEADHPYLGVSPANLTPEIAEQFGISVESGALVVGVDPNGPAAETGIEVGSVITGLDHQKIDDAGDLLAALRGHSPGDEVEVTVAAEGEAREVSVELAERL